MMLVNYVLHKIYIKINNINFSENPKERILTVKRQDSKCASMRLYQGPLPYLKALSERKDILKIHER